MLMADSIELQPEQVLTRVLEYENGIVLSCVKLGPGHIEMRAKADRNAPISESLELRLDAETDELVVISTRDDQEHYWQLDREFLSMFMRPVDIDAPALDLATNLALSKELLLRMAKQRWFKTDPMYRRVDDEF